MSLALDSGAMAPRVAQPRAVGELAQALQAHMQHCQPTQRHWFDAAVLAERAHRVLAPRFVTTLAVATVLLAVTIGWT